MAKDEYDLGVLFVHGIGNQPKSDTLLRFGEPLQKWLYRWITGDGANAQAASVQVSNADLTLSETPAHAELVISTSVKQSRWLLAEAWWAKAFPPPRYRDLWKWVLMVSPLAIASHFARGYWLARNKSGMLVALGKFVLAAIVLPIIVMAMAGLLLLGIVPIPQLRAAIHRAQLLLVGTVGDSYIYLTSSIKGAAVISKVQKDIKWLAEQHCTKIAIVAHSQGAAVVHAALKQPSTPCPDLLLTFGSGLNKLLTLDLKRDKTAVVSTWLLSLSILLFAWAVGFIVPSLVSGAFLHTEIPELPVSWLLSLLGFDFRNLWMQLLFVSAAIYLFWLMITLLVYNKKHKTSRKTAELSILKAIWFVIAISFESATGWIAVVAILTFNIFIITEGGAFVLLAAVIIFLIWAHLDRKSSTPFFLNDDIDSQMELKGVGSWKDFYATADPVPNGPLSLQEVSYVKSQPVHNTGSIFSDHSAYWSNLDEFVSHVTRALAQTAGLDIEDMSAGGSARLERARRRRIWRVHWLRSSRWLILVGGIIWMWALRSLAWADASSMPYWLTSAGEAGTTLIANMPVIGAFVSTKPLNLALAKLLWYSGCCLAMWAAYRLVYCVWLWWEREDLAALFSGADYYLFPNSFVVLLTMLVIIASTALGSPWFAEMSNVVNSVFSTHDSMSNIIGSTLYLAIMAGVGGALAEGIERKDRIDERFSFLVIQHALKACPLTVWYALFEHRMVWMVYPKWLVPIACFMIGFALHFIWRWLGKLRS
jgi:hypothetical protein